MMQSARSIGAFIVE